jgi:hypothetical protein
VDHFGEPNTTGRSPTRLSWALTQLWTSTDGTPSVSIVTPDPLLCLVILVSFETYWVYKFYKAPGSKCSKRRPEGLNNKLFVDLRISMLVTWLISRVTRTFSSNPWDPWDPIPKSGRSTIYFCSTKITRDCHFSPFSCTVFRWKTADHWDLLTTSRLLPGCWTATKRHLHSCWTTCEMNWTSKHGGYPVSPKISLLKHLSFLLNFQIWGLQHEADNHWSCVVLALPPCFFRMSSSKPGLDKSLSSFPPVRWPYVFDRWSKSMPRNGANLDGEETHPIKPDYYTSKISCG